MSIHRAVLALVLCLAAGVAIFEKSRTKTIETPDGPVTAITRTVDPTPQEIVVASGEQLESINALAARARTFASTYLPHVQNPTLKDFDEAFRIWQKSKDKRFSEHEVIEVLGAHLGNTLNIELDMEWVIVTDKDGRDYGVRGKKHEVISYPFSSVAKRVESNQYDFMAGVFYVVRDMLSSGNSKTR